MIRHDDGAMWGDKGVEKQCALRVDSSFPSFGAALLAGGGSKRMGSDKALFQIDSAEGPIPLWLKQWKLLRSLGPAELLFSGPARPGLPKDVVVLADRWDSSGPLAGIATCLDHVKTEFLLILAVDLPYMNSDCLFEILRESSRFRAGIVPVLNQRFEPLAAIYPKSAMERAVERVAQNELKLQDLVNELVLNRTVVPWDVPQERAFCFVNWNEPWQVKG
jgi:molybdenum cofactor guanylyltransferase